MITTKWVARPALLVLACMLPLAAVAPASASSLPLVSPNSNCWHGRTRPPHIFTGQGSSPEAISLHWTHYGAAYGHATGVVLYPSSGSAPRAASVNVHRPRHHGTRIFFTRMRWTFHRPNGTLQTVYWRFGPEVPGATCAVWDR